MSWSVAHYFMTSIDDFTRKNFYFLKIEDDVFEKFRNSSL